MNAYCRCIGKLSTALETVAKAALPALNIRACADLVDLPIQGISMSKARFAVIGTLIVSLAACSGGGPSEGERHDAFL
ncbi:hypothetical protein LN470_10745, partial [Xanthomonas phaseoli]|nr:hypothetical protein [Xanthomonas phaseoli]